MSDSIPARRQRRKEARPGEIIAAALAIFHAKGFAASKIEDVARVAGVTKGTVYLYFSSKEALFKAAIRETILPNLDRIKETALAETTARAQLYSAVRLWTAGMSTCRGSTSKLMIAEAGNFPELAEFYRDEVSGRVRRMLSDIIEYGIAQNEFRPCDPAMLARILCGPIVLSNIWRHTFVDPHENQPDMDALADSLLDVVLNGIVSHPKAPL
ncbi:MAG: TetR/AcrR family transcriptional regulator [Formivibrio sp.]|nr:TetR/AcrR family transcriptional regulator [Formivibrio sp.]